MRKSQELDLMDYWITGALGQGDSLLNLMDYLFPYHVFFLAISEEKEYAKRVPPICVYHKYSLEAKSVILTI